MHNRQVKRAARSRVRRYVRRGILERQPCLLCGDPQTEAHHPTYDQPWLVQWLCAGHHRQVHAPVEPGQLLVWLGA